MTKKWKGFIAILVCMLVLTACGGAGTSEEQEIPEETRTALFGYTEMTVQSLDELTASEEAASSIDDAAVLAGLQSWRSAKEEIGSVDFTVDADGNGVADCFTEKSLIVDEEGSYVVTVGVAGTEKNADFVASYTSDLTGYVSLVANVEYSFSELMQQAGLNTLLGMGMTFAVLILLSLIIALFGNVLSSKEKKKADEAAVKEEAEQQNAVYGRAGAASQGSLAGTPDDGALIAVIAAAVAAYRSEAEPGLDPDAFVVRKIRRIRRS